MDLLKTSGDRRDLERRELFSARLRAVCGSLAPTFFFVSLLLSMLPADLPHRFEAFVLSLVFVAMSIVCGVLARQWIFVYVVVGIVTVLVVLASVPRRHGISNESAAAANLRTINTAEATYKSSPDGRYGTLKELIDAKLLDDTFAGTKAGYIYSITLDETGSVYTAEANPASAKTGRYGYYTVPDAVVRYSTDALLAPRKQAGKLVQ